MSWIAALSRAYPYGYRRHMGHWPCPAKDFHTTIDGRIPWSGIGAGSTMVPGHAGAHIMDDTEQPLSLILFSGTDDKLTAASTLVVGAAALGRRVDVLLQFWGLDAFRTDSVRTDHGLAPEATDAE